MGKQRTFEVRNDARGNENILAVQYVARRRFQKEERLRRDLYNRADQQKSTTDTRELTAFLSSLTWSR